MNQRMRAATLWCAPFAAALAVGCGGGSGSNATAPPPLPSALVSAAPVVGGALRLVVPLAAAQSSRRGPAWVSPSVRSVHLVVNNASGSNAQDYDVGAASPNCTTSAGARTCTLAFGAPPGSDTFAVTLYDGPVVAGKASGTAIGNGNAIQTVVLGSPFNVSITAAGIGQTVSVAVSPATFNAGTPTTAAVTVTVTDADGNVIAGPYAGAASLSTTDTTGALTLSSTSIVYGQTVTLTYNGGSNLSGALVKVSQGANVGSTNVNVTGGAGALAAVPIPLPTSTSYSRLWDLTTGPDNNVWVVVNGSGAVVRVDPAGVAPGAVVSTGSVTRLIGIASLGGNVWFFGGNGPASVGSIAPSLAPGPTATLIPSSRAAYLTAGPDGNLWAIDEGNNMVARITTAGVVSEFPVAGIGSGAYANAHITTGPDGAMWFTIPENNTVARITTAGTVTATYPLPTPSGFAVDTVSGNPHGIAKGPDGNLWIAESQTNRIAKMTTSGAVTEYALPQTLVAPEAIVAGPDGNLWFTTTSSGNIGKISVSGQPTAFNVSGFGSLVGYGIVSGPNGNLYTTITQTTGPPAILRFAPQ